MFLRRLGDGVERGAQASYGELVPLAEADQRELLRLFAEDGDRLVAAAGEAGFIDGFAPGARLVAFGDENEEVIELGKFRFRIDLYFHGGRIVNDYIGTIRSARRSS